MPTIPFPHVSWLQVVAPPAPIRAFKNLVVREFGFDELAAATEAARAPETAPFPREDPPEPEEPRSIPLCLMDQTPWPFHTSKVSSALSAVCRVTAQETVAGPYANISSDSAKPSVPIRTNSTQERPPPELHPIMR